jgi:NAD(P)-dependent dehydrogenase (short-subunit alcohol dehydrogenase family)
MARKTILITGANKGIGFETARQLAKLKHTVILTARNEESGKAAVAMLAAENLLVHFQRLDITSPQSIQEATLAIGKQFTTLDVLINNAAILLKEDKSLLTSEWSAIEKTVQTVALAQLQFTRAFAPLLPVGGRIIMVSSEGGSMTDPVGGWAPAYCISKSMVNAMTRHLAHELKSKNVSVNAMCPGWVKTDMGGASAPRTTEQGADTAVWLATETNTGTGNFYRDRKEIEW